MMVSAGLTQKCCAVLTEFLCWFTSRTSTAGLCFLTRQPSTASLVENNLNFIHSCLFLVSIMSEQQKMCPLYNNLQKRKSVTTGGNDTLHPSLGTQLLAYKDTWHWKGFN